jgi:GNAT superfamily N-acetyltransferase
MWEAILKGPHSDHHFVAEVAGKLVGFAGSVPAVGEAPGQAELWGIYLLRDQHGSGLGQQLLDAALGNDPASLWVVRDNLRAQLFYRRNGFEFDGSQEIVEDWESMTECRMIRRA